MKSLEKRKAEIRAAKGRLKINYTDVARELGIAPQTVGQVADLRGRSRRVVEALVARGMPAKLFPEYELGESPPPQPSPLKGEGVKGAQAGSLCH